MLTIPAMRTNQFQHNSNRFRFKAPLNSPTFTGTVSGIDKTMVGLSMWIIPAMRTNLFPLTQIALDLKANLASHFYRNCFWN
jgi:hypothetical protein